MNSVPPVSPTLLVHLRPLQPVESELASHTFTSSLFPLHKLHTLLPALVSRLSRVSPACASPVKQISSLPARVALQIPSLGGPSSSIGAGRLWPSQPSSAICPPFRQPLIPSPPLRCSLPPLCGGCICIVFNLAVRLLVGSTTDRKADQRSGQPVNKGTRPRP